MKPNKLYLQIEKHFWPINSYIKYETLLCTSLKRAKEITSRRGSVISAIWTEKTENGYIKHKII